MYTGLTAVLFLEQDEYIEALSPSAGARVLIHHRDEQPFPEDDGLDANPGQKMSIKLSMVGIIDMIDMTLICIQIHNFAFN